MPYLYRTVSQDECYEYWVDLRNCLVKWNIDIPKDVRAILTKLLTNDDLSKKELDKLKKAIKDNNIPDCVQAAIDCYVKPTTDSTTPAPTTTT